MSEFKDAIEAAANIAEEEHAEATSHYGRVIAKRIWGRIRSLSPATGGGGDTSTSKPSSPCDTDAAAQWRPIESAPKDGRRVLIFNALGNVHVGRWGCRYVGDAGPEAWVNEGKYIAVPSHWMPLPAAPSEPQVNNAHVDEACGPAAAVKPTIIHKQRPPFKFDDPPPSHGVGELPSEEWQPIETAPKDGTK